MHKLRIHHLISFLFFIVLIASGCSSTEVDGIQAPGEIQMTISSPLAENNEKFGVQELQINVEVRFLTVTDNFFEEIGIDFRGISGEQNVDGIGNFQFNEDPNAFSGGTIFKRDEEGFPFGESKVDINLLMKINDQSIALNGTLIESDLNIMFLVQAIESKMITDTLGRPRLVTINNVELDITPIVGAAQNNENNLPQFPENP